MANIVSGVLAFSYEVNNVFSCSIIRQMVGVDDHNGLVASIGMTLTDPIPHEWGSDGSLVLDIYETPSTARKFVLALNWERRVHNPSGPIDYTFGYSMPGVASATIDVAETPTAGDVLLCELLHVSGDQMTARFLKNGAEKASVTDTIVLAGSLFNCYCEGRITARIGGSNVFGERAPFGTVYTQVDNFLHGISR